MAGIGAASPGNIHAYENIKTASLRLATLEFKLRRTDVTDEKMKVLGEQLEVIKSVMANARYKISTMRGEINQEIVIAEERIREIKKAVKGQKMKQENKDAVDREINKLNEKIKVCNEMKRIIRKALLDDMMAARLMRAHK